MSYLWLPYMILPIYAGLERIPQSLISASEDLGASPFTTFRRVIFPLAFPAVVAGSIFTFSLTLGDYITPKLVSNSQFIGNTISNSITSDRPFAGGALAMVQIVFMIAYLAVARKLGAFEHVTRRTRRARALLRTAVGLGLAFIYVPLIVIVIYSFNSSKILKSRPPPGWTTEWFTKAFESESVREALLTSAKAGVAATLIAMLLGTLAALAVGRHRFFGRETVSFLVILPIALPGIDRVALSNTFTQVLGVSLAPLDGDHRACDLLRRCHLHNAVARLRRVSGSFEEASADLGAHTWQTFRYITFPSIAPPSPPAGCSPSPSPSTRSSSPTSPSAPAKKRCRSGSSATSSAPTSCRSSTPSRCW